MTDQYAVFGNPIAHSKSPDIHAAFAAEVGHDIAYDKQCVEVGQFAAAASAFFDNGGKGLNVTVPFKQDAYEFADQLSERAQAAGAVNTLAVQKDGSILGDNTDGEGLVSDICVHLGWAVADKSVLVLGAGGAVRGILLPLIRKAPKDIVIANRTVEKAEVLAGAFAEHFSITSSGFEGVPHQKPFDLIINGTSASLAGDLPPLPTSVVGPETHVYDMMYGAEPTLFMRWAEEQGATAFADGLGMLVGQAAESFRIWRGVSVDVVPVLKGIREQL